MIGSQHNTLKYLHPDRALIHRRTGSHTQKERRNRMTNSHNNVSGVHCKVTGLMPSDFCTYSSWKRNKSGQKTQKWMTLPTLTRLVTTAGHPYISQTAWCLDVVDVVDDDYLIYSIGNIVWSTLFPCLA